MNPDTESEALMRQLLDSFAGPYYVAGTPTQRNQVIQHAAQALEPKLVEIVRRHVVQETKSP